MRVLVVEDDVRLLRRLVEGLRREQFAVDAAPDGIEALAKIDAVAYDVVVLDRDLPGVHGDIVCAQIVRAPVPPRVLMLTAAADVDDRIDGLTMGADDYLGKPFDFRELVLRLRALGRRGRPSGHLLTCGDLVLDPLRRTATRAGSPLLLGAKEFAVLEVLLQAEGGVVSAEQLIDKVWDENANLFSNNVAVTISRLRRHLGNPPLLETRYGQGYRITSQP